MNDDPILNPQSNKYTYSKNNGIIKWIRMDYILVHQVHNLHVEVVQGSILVLIGVWVVNLFVQLCEVFLIKIL